MPCMRGHGLLRPARISAAPMDQPKASDRRTSRAPPSAKTTWETVLKWISGGGIEEYMSAHQHDPNAAELWDYFRSVIDWTQATFPKKRASMKSVAWGPLYEEHHERRDLDPARLEAEVMRLNKDDDVTSKRGIYPYVLTRDEKHLNIRAFTPAMREAAYETGKRASASLAESTSLLAQWRPITSTPWSEGGKTTPENCQMLCRPCNRRKGGQIAPCG